MSSLKSLLPPSSGIDQTEITRDATASIRGYIYQFDATIRAILQLSENDSLVIEGVEDFDALSEADLMTTHSQCKYYEAQRPTDAVVRDAIFPMLKHFADLDASKKTTRKYVLYGHFKEKDQSVEYRSLADLKRIMVTKKKAKAELGETEDKTINLLTEHGIQEDDVRLFVDRFEIQFCEKYEEHKAGAVRDLQSAIGVSLIEAEELVYPTALTIIANMASCSDAEKRTISKKSFLEKIKPSSTLYHVWHLRERGEEQFAKEMKKRHFAALNLESHDRFFAVDVQNVTNVDSVYRILRHIIANWSSYASLRKRNDERYAPYVLFNGISPDDLADIKGRLMEEGIALKDGYPFNDSPFNPLDLAMPQTKENRIAVRLVKDMDEFQIAIASQRRQREVCHFFMNTPLSPPGACRFVGIPIKSITMVESIL